MAELPLQCCKGYSRPYILSTLLFIWFWFYLPGLILCMIPLPPSRRRCVSRTGICIILCNLSLKKQCQKMKQWHSDCLKDFTSLQCIIVCFPHPLPDSFVPFPRQGVTVAAQTAEFSHWEVVQNKTYHNKADQTWAETVFFISSPWICGMVLEIAFCSEVDLIWGIWK